MFLGLTLLPASAINTQYMWKQKRRGRNLLLLIPVVWPSHCPFTKISNSASPRRAVYKRPSPKHCVRCFTLFMLTILSA